MDKVTIGDAECYNCDCMTLMRSMPSDSVDFILTDIPYELDLNGGIGKGGAATRKGAQNRTLGYIADGIDYDAVFSEFIRICKGVNVCVFCSNKQIGKIMTWWEGQGYVATLLVWDKPNPLPLANGNYISNLEFIVYVRSKYATFNNLGVALQMKSFRYPAPGKERLHETEKPVQILSRLLLLHTNEGDVVFDPYAGSFSTAIACHNEKRRFIGCEIKGNHFCKAMKRLALVKAQQSLF